MVLRHYYIGAARAKCLESAISSVPVALREVRVRIWVRVRVRPFLSVRSSFERGSKEICGLEAVGRTIGGNRNAIAECKVLY